MDEKTLRKQREKLDKALAANRDDEAIKLLAVLVGAEPTNARWPHKRGDLLRKVGRRAEAVASYEVAVDVYAKSGFIARAVAMAKTVLSLDPSRTDVLMRVDPQAAQELHRKSRPASILPKANTSSGSGAKHPAVLDDAAPPPSATGSGSRKHPMVLDSLPPVAAAPDASEAVASDLEADEITVEVEEEPAPARHPMVLDDEPVAAARPSPAPEKVDVAAALAARKRRQTLSDADTMAVPVTPARSQVAEEPSATAAPESVAKPAAIVNEKADVVAALAARKRRPTLSDADTTAVPAVAPNHVEEQRGAAPAPARATPKPDITSPAKVDVAAALAARKRTTLLGVDPAMNARAASPPPTAATPAATPAAEGSAAAQVPVAPVAPAASPPPPARPMAAAAPPPPPPAAATVTSPGGPARGRAAPPPPPPSATRPKAPPPPIPGVPAKLKPQPVTEPLTLDRLSLPPMSADEPAADSDSGLQPMAAAPSANDAAAASAPQAIEAPAPAASSAKEAAAPEVPNAATAGSGAKPNAAAVAAPPPAAARPLGATPAAARPLGSPPLAAGARAPAAGSAFGAPPAAAGAGVARPKPAAGSAFGAPPSAAGATAGQGAPAGAPSAAKPPPLGTAFGSRPGAASVARAGAPAPAAARVAVPPAAAAVPPPAAAPAARTADPGSHSGQLWADRSGGHDVPAAPLVPAAPPPSRHRGPTMLGAGPRIKPYEPPPDEAELFSRALEAAVELKVDPAAKPNETRFSDAPPGPGPELSTEELSERPPAALHEQHDAVPHAVGALSNLPLFPLFAEMPQAVLADMIQGTELIELSDGDVVLRKGDPGDALFGIVEGSVAVGVPNQTHTLTLAEGDVFGESCLLQDEPRHADVRVVGRLTALKIPREVLLRTLRGYPKLAELLLELLTRRLLGNLLQTSPLFSEFDAEGRRQLSRLFEVRRAPANTRLAIAGKRMDGLYISLTGTLLVETPGQEPRIVTPGSMFGQHTLLSQQPSPSSVTARVNLVVLRLPSAAFAQVAMQYPTVVERLAELSTSDVVSVGL